MNSDWTLVIVLWGALIGIMIGCLVPEFKKTPEQRQAEAQKIRESFIKKREDEKKARQEAKNNAPAKGCLQSTVQFGCLCLFLMIAVIVCIMLLVASGN